MKTVAVNRRTKIHYPAYPNAADRQYYFEKLLDGALAVATAVGGIVVVLFLLLL